MRDASDPVAAGPGRDAAREAFFAALADRPWEHDFFQTLRRIECLDAQHPRLGSALRPADEPVRFGQDVSMAFAPAPLAALVRAPGQRPHLLQRFFGMLGVNGPLPLHLTDYVRERLLHHGDRTLAAFLDLFHHRFLALFYRAWAQAQPTVSLDRPREDRFAAYVGALVGIGAPAMRERDAAGDFAKLHHAGLLARHVRNADGLEALIAGYFRMPVRIEQFVGHWMELPAAACTRLGQGGDGARLGRGVVLGRMVWDRQHKLRIAIGPLDLARYESFLPGGAALARLVALVRQYLCFELDWDVRLRLAPAQVPRPLLGRYGRIGRSTWLGGRRAGNVELVLDPEALLARRAAGGFATTKIDG